MSTGSHSVHSLWTNLWVHLFVRPVLTVDERVGNLWASCGHRRRTCGPLQVCPHLRTTLWNPLWTHDHLTMPAVPGDAGITRRESTVSTGPYYYYLAIDTEQGVDGGCGSSPTGSLAVPAAEDRMVYSRGDVTHPTPVQALHERLDESLRCRVPALASASSAEISTWVLSVAHRLGLTATETVRFVCTNAPTAGGADLATGLVLRTAAQLGVTTSEAARLLTETGRLGEPEGGTGGEPVRRRPQRPGR